jgi:hypothetical protein
MMLSRVSIDRLRINLCEQIDFVSASCDRYDDGHESEAKRIALSLRVLVHDTDRSSSLLELLDIKGSLPFVDTADSLMVTPTFEMPLGLVVAVMDSGEERYQPILDCLSSDNRVPFDEWWNRALVRPVDHAARSRRGEREAFTRRDFVLGMANMEGGGHVDPSPSRWWHDLRDQTYLGAMRLEDDQPIANFVPATIRQIGWEVLETFSLPAE